MPEKGLKPKDLLILKSWEITDNSLSDRLLKPPGRIVAIGKSTNLKDKRLCVLSKKS